MPIRDVAVANDFLDLMLESDSWEYALFDEDAMLDGVELDSTTAPGYDRVMIAPADWAPAADWSKGVTVPAQLPDPTAEWVEATHWGLFRVSDGALGPTGALTEPLAVTSAGDGPLVSPVVFFDDAVEPPV